MKTNRLKTVLSILLVLALVLWYGTGRAGAQTPSLELHLGGGGEEPAALVGTLQLLLVLALLSLAPAMIMLMTSFTRIVVVLAFVRNALATPQIPPNQVLIGLAIFLTFFVMSPTLNRINEEALQPYLAGEIEQEEAIAAGSGTIREFMLPHTREKDLQLFMGLAGLEVSPPAEGIPLYALIPSFVISELKTAFQMGFVVFIPFLIIDMVVASTLMSMGMFMLPPVIVSLPFKLMLFVLVDGWYLVIKSLMESLF